MNKAWSSLLLLLLLFNALPALGQTFVTWQGLEADKLASMWLIKRFVDQDAKFLLLARGSRAEQGIAFDVPSAVYKRSHNLSTFEHILEDKQLHDERLLYIGRIIHDIEINTWETKKLQQTAEVQEALQKIIDRQPDEQLAIGLAMEFFDQLYARPGESRSAKVEP